MKSELKFDRAALGSPKTSWLRVILGTLLVLAGLTSALVTVLARDRVVVDDLHRAATRAFRTR